MKQKSLSGPVMEGAAASASDGKSSCRKAVLTEEMVAKGEISSYRPIATSVPCWIFVTNGATQQSVESMVGEVIRKVAMAAIALYVYRLERWFVCWIQGL